MAKQFSLLIWRIVIILLWRDATMIWAWYCSMVRMEASGEVLGIVCGSITGKSEISTKQNTLINPRWRDKKPQGVWFFPRRSLKERPIWWSFFLTLFPHLWILKLQMWDFQLSLSFVTLPCIVIVNCSSIAIMSLLTFSASIFLF